jgi:MFS family permease
MKRAGAAPLPARLIAYALAWAGGSVAYTPFLTLLLPLRFTELAGGNDVLWLGLSTTVGALAASVGNILWGHVSDRTGLRLPLSLLGLLFIALSSVAIARSMAPLALVCSVAVWQLGINLFLAPLAAYAADTVPNSKKGALGGLLALGPGIAALSTVAISLAPPTLGLQLTLILTFVLICSAPLFAIDRVASPPPAEAPADGAFRQGGTRKALLQLWVARLAVQVAEGILFVFLFYYLRSLSDGSLPPERFAFINVVAQFSALPIALLAGRRSDRTGRRRGPLLLLVLLLMTGLVAMSTAPTWTTAALGYVLFVVGSTSFLALHSAFAMQQLREARHYGRDLGLFNLTNTLPALVSPMIAALVIGRVGYDVLLLGLAVAMLIPAWVIARLDHP